MKKLMVMASLFIALASCEKNTDGFSNTTIASEVDDAVTRRRTYSSFDKGTEGWTTENGAKVGFSTMGLPGGPLKGVDEGSPTYWYFVAPVEYITGLPSFGNYRLYFDLKSPSTNNTNERDIIIESPSVTIVLDISNDPSGTTWTAYSADLTDASNWRMRTLDGPKATNIQIKYAIRNVTKLAIREEFSTNAGNKGFLDNVFVVRIR